MFVSKFWTMLLAIALGIAVGVIFLARDVVNRERVDNSESVLYKEMSKVDVALKLHARSRLDVLLGVATDPAVRRYLSAANGSSERSSKVRGDLLGVLRKRNEEMGKYKADRLLALDADGNVVAQVGPNERQHGYVLKGFPAVDWALRGYLRDDMWKLGNDVFLVAARPVIEQGRYAGAVVHLMKVNDALAGELSPQMQLAFYAGDMMIAVGKPKSEDAAQAQGAVIAKPLDEVKKSEQFAKKGYSHAIRIDSDDSHYMAVYGKVRGEASRVGVGYALVVPLEMMGSATEFYEKAAAQDVQALPFIGIILVVLLATAFGWVWNYLEAQRPTKRLLAHVRSLKESDPKDQLNVYRFRRRMRKIAMAINELIDYKIKALMETANIERPAKSIDAILGPRGESRVSEANFKFAGYAGDDIPPPPPAQSDTGRPASLGGLGMPAPPPAGGSAPMNGGGIPAVGSEEEQAYFHQIYQEFIGLKNRLGESTDQLTFDRFVGTLRKNRDTLISRYNCKQVKFQVYEKDGKASLKATPVRA